MIKGKSLNPAEIERAAMTKSDFFKLLDQHAGSASAGLPVAMINEQALVDAVAAHDAMIGR